MAGATCYFKAVSCPFRYVFKRRTPVLTFIEAETLPSPSQGPLCLLLLALQFWKPEGCVIDSVCVFWTAELNRNSIGLTKLSVFSQELTC